MAPQISRRLSPFVRSCSGDFSPSELGNAFTRGIAPAAGVTEAGAEELAIAVKEADAVIKPAGDGSLAMAVLPSSSAWNYPLLQPAAQPERVPRKE
jgi:hypothetical protein